MTATMRVRIFVAGVLFLGAFPAAASADTFTVINNSNDTVYAVVLYWTPYSSSSGGLMVVTPAQWTATGWYSIQPGKRIDIYSGDQARIYVRLSKGSGISGTPIVPRNYEKKISYGVHAQRFEIAEQSIGSGNKIYTLCHGDSLQHRKSGPSLAATGASIVDGFHYVTSHTDFTVR